MAQNMVLTYLHFRILKFPLIETSKQKLLPTRNGHGQSGWPPIGCEGFYTKSADPGLGQGRSGAWDHRRCGTSPS